MRRRRVHNGMLPRIQCPTLATGKGGRGHLPTADTSWGASPLCCKYVKSVCVFFMIDPSMMANPDRPVVDLKIFFLVAADSGSVQLNKLGVRRSKGGTIYAQLLVI